MSLGFVSARRLLKLAGIALFLVVVYLVVTVAQIWWTARQNQSPHVEAIVVMGAAEYDGTPSPDLAARLSHALALWRKGVATTIVVTGGRESGDQFTEAGVSAAWLETRNVPSGEIVEADQARDSYQSVAAAAKAVLRTGQPSVVMVSDPFHEQRILGMAARLGLVAYPSPTRTSPIRGFAVIPYYGRETTAVAVGRIIGYQALSEWLHP
ncbi:MAG: YdcF family protein [Acidimicrobiales bacterium]